MNNIIKRAWNQNRMTSIEDLQGMAFQAEAGGHTFEISGIDDQNNAVSLSGTVAGVFMRPDGTDVALTGTASDGVVSVTLSDACYAVAGRFGLTIFVTADSNKTCVYACVGTVAQSSYGTVAGDTPQSVVDLINAINAAIASIPADYTDLMAAIAPTYSDAALYAKGAYAWQNGVLYRCKTTITTAESWTAARWTAAVIGNDVADLKSALSAFNCYDYVLDCEPQSRTLYGVTFVWDNDGNCTVSGTATSTTFSNIWSNTAELPDWLEKGKTYRIKISATNTRAQFWLYKNGSYLTGSGSANDFSVTVPSDATGLVFRLTVDSGVTVNETVHVSLVDTYSNQELSELLNKTFFETQQTALASCDIDTIVADGCYLLIDSNTYTNAPFTVGFLAVLHPNAGCLQIGIPWTPNKIYMRRCLNNANWTAWESIAGVNNYTFNEIQNTYNVTATPTITADSNAFLAASGDTTDRTADIVTMLTTYGVCRLGKGVFYISNLVMPDNTSIVGSGHGTRIQLIGSSDGFAIKLGSYCAVSDCWIYGGYDSAGASSTVGGRHGILWQGTYTQDQIAPYRGIISNVYISGFSGGGITCEDTGYGTTNCIEATNLHINACGAGLNISYVSEFHKFTNVRCASCYYGCINNGGNNVFVNCDFSSNKLGFLMDNENNQSPNNSHGSAIGCVFNHTNGNAGVGIKILNCANGFVFDACQIFFSQIYVEDSDGVVFSNCNFGSTNCVITIDGGGAVLFANNMHQATPTISITDNAKVHFANCYVRSTGAVVAA